MTLVSKDTDGPIDPSSPLHHLTRLLVPELARLDQELRDLLGVLLGPLATYFAPRDHAPLFLMITPETDRSALLLNCSKQPGSRIVFTASRQAQYNSITT